MSGAELMTTTAILVGIVIGGLNLAAGNAFIGACCLAGAAVGILSMAVGD